MGLCQRGDAGVFEPALVFVFGGCTGQDRPLEGEVSSRTAA